MKYAHYFASKKQKTLTISETTRPIGPTVKVTGLKEARTIAKEVNAKPWNF